MNSLEKKKKQVEYERVKLGVMEFELRIEERLQDIKRLEEHLETQKAKVVELEAELKTINGEE